VIKLDKNFGPAAARNIGYKAASCDLILFMDNDVSLAPSCSDQLIQALNDSRHAVTAMPRVLYAHNKNTIQYDGADNHFLGLMILDNVNQTLNTSTDSTRKIGTIVTACFLIDRRKWGERDLFDDTFFFNYEDFDFGMRTRILGFEILSVPSAHCYHRKGTEGLSLREGGKYSRTRVFCLIRNRWQIILKNYEFKTLLLISPVFFIYEIFQLAGVVKKGWLVEWLKAFSWIILHSFEILRKRRNIQEARKIRDREILRNGPIPFRESDLIKSPWERMGINFLNRFAAFYWKRIERFI
jgi:GT2 family glycosyltransferase